MGAASAAVLALGAWYGTQYWTVGRFEVSTDDAYVQADNTTIAPRVSGYLDEVLVGDNEQVKAGQVLARIDRARLHGSAGPGESRCRGIAGGGRGQAGFTRHPAIHHRGRERDAGGRPRQRKIRRSRKTSVTRIWRRPASAPRRMRSRRPRGSPRRPPACSATRRRLPPPPSRSACSRPSWRRPRLRRRIILRFSVRPN